MSPSAFPSRSPGWKRLTKVEAEPVKCRRNLCFLNVLRPAVSSTIHFAHIQILKTSAEHNGRTAYTREKACRLGTNGSSCGWDLRSTSVNARVKASCTGCLGQGREGLMVASGYLRRVYSREQSSTGLSRSRSRQSQNVLQESSTL